MKGFWAQFRRLHLGAMFGHRVAVISAVIGVAIGASLVIATQLLRVAFSGPQDVADGGHGDGGKDPAARLDLQELVDGIASADAAAAGFTHGHRHE